jgi:hypothetical protein
LLGTPVTDRHAHFFALGGHSLLAAQLAFRIGETLHAAVPITLVHTHGTLAEMAAFVDGMTGSAASTVAGPIPRRRRAADNGPDDHA